MLLWMLKGFNNLKMRAYVARFLKSFAIPKEFFVDPIINDLYNQLQTEKSKFRKVHSQALQIQDDDAQSVVNQLKNEQKQLRNEKDQLITKLDKMMTKINNELYQNFGGNDQNGNSNDNDRFNGMLNATSQLRKFQEEEALLYERAYDMRRQHRMNQKYINQLLAQKNDLQEIMQFLNENIGNQHFNNNQILQRLSLKIDEKRLKISKLEDEIGENEEMLQDAVSMLHSEPINDQQVESLQDHVDSLEQQVMQLENQRDKLLEFRINHCTLFIFFSDIKLHISSCIIK